MLSDWLGRKKVLMIAALLFTVSAVGAALPRNLWEFVIARVLGGFAIGAASMLSPLYIAEVAPARIRGRLVSLNQLAIVGGMLVVYFVNSRIAQLGDDAWNQTCGWRWMFGSGALPAVIFQILLFFVPESPRWLMIHGRPAEAERVMAGIEARIMASERVTLAPTEATLALGDPHKVTLVSVARTLLRHYPGRTTLGLVLMASQAFVYNAIFFTYALILTRFYGVPGDKVGLYILPFAVGNFLGPLLLGPLFDTLGRRIMITATYGFSGLLLAGTAWLFQAGLLDATTQTTMWTIVFFFASAAASAAYLTVGECFPLEIRALTIALFYAFGTLLGGVGGPWLFGVLIEGGAPGEIVMGYLLGATLMIAAALVTLKLGVAAECRSLEEVAPPLSTAP